mmetsp:Transcript_95183/g.274101  ORF Transcript_95183/g.274101 Transcript_95183/m.274101 type:complete len:225 (-) Transcript_95183:342-1016(-)
MPSPSRSASELSPTPSLSKSFHSLGSRGRLSSLFTAPSPSISSSVLSPMPSLSKSPHSFASWGKRSSSLRMPSPSRSALSLASWSSPSASSSSCSDPTTRSCFNMSQIFASASPSTSLQCSSALSRKLLHVPTPVDDVAHMSPRNCRHFSCVHNSGRCQHSSARMALIALISGRVAFLVFFAASSSCFSHSSFIFLSTGSNGSSPNSMRARSPLNASFPRSASK